jgi:lipopolysaccharide heptosyltransferase II
MKILVRLPNWLGDMVMSLPFIQQLHRCYPGAEVDVIAKKGIDALLPFMPGIRNSFVFSKEEYKGVRGLWQFGRFIRSQGQYDLFFCLPDSFSSAFMGMATGAKVRIGYKKELREALLHRTYTRPTNLHRVEEYLQLLQMYTGQPLAGMVPMLDHNFPRKNHIVVNINSEASSRRLTTVKAVQLLNALRAQVQNPLVLIGAPKERPFVEAVFQQLESRQGIQVAAGSTSLPQLVELLASASLMLTTDSGPAHLANALGTPTVVLFGAGNENNTAPYNKELLRVVRLGKLSCEPCVRNECVQFETPQCLELLDNNTIVELVQQQMRIK